tara:strand:- start:3335 stop:5620 length:2286 start_codon:yes stop_codon:yes gene_type:complete
LKYLGRKILFFLIILIPFWSFLVWFFYPKIELPGLILDKTVLDRSGVEHRSFNWITTNNKYVKKDGSQYEITEDYYGFFPVNRPEYVVKDLTVFSQKEIDSLARDLEYIYYTDAYGIYTNEWVYGRDINERSRLVYGGLSQQSYLLFEKMFRNRKLTITEFNNIASPTSLNLRYKMQRVLESDFTGWTGRYYHSLDTLLNPDIPGWMKRLHRRYYKKPFDYPDIPGLVLVHETERILILQAGVDLDYEIPILNTGDTLVKRYGLPEFIRYPYWFDINFAKDTNNVYATYKIHTNARGDSILGSQLLPNEFPAILADHKENLRWYFCGDWADSPTPFGLSYFKGVQFLRKFFYNNRDELDRKKFFWEYYEPLISGIFEDYIEIKDSISGPRPLPSSYPNYVPYYRRNNMPLPDIDLIASGRVYDPEEVLGTRYKERAYRDSVLQAEREEAARTGYYIGEYGDTVYLSQGEIAELEAQARFEQETQEKRDSINQRRLDSIRGDGQFNPRYRMQNAGVKPALRRGGRLPYRIPLSKEDLAKREAYRDSLRLLREERLQSREDSLAAIRQAKIEATMAEQEAAEAASEEQVEQVQVEDSYKRGARLKAAGSSPKAIDENKDTSEESELLNEVMIVSDPNRYRVGGRLPSSHKQETVEAEPQDSKVEEEDAIDPLKPRGEVQESLPPVILAGENEKAYHIIVASFTEKEQAEDFLKKKKSEDMKLIYFPEKGTYRISKGSYPSIKEADRALINLLGSYPGAWLLKV